MAAFELKGLSEMLANIERTLVYAHGPEIKAAVYAPAGEEFKSALEAAAPRARQSAAEAEADTVPIREAVTKLDGPAHIPNVLVFVDPEKAPAAGEVEYGTGERFTRTGAYRGSMGARPFFRPTVRVERPGIVAAVAAGWLKEITDPLPFPGSRSV